MANVISKFDGRAVKNSKVYRFYNGVYTTTACGRYIKASISELKSLVKNGRISDLTINIEAL